MLASLLFLFVNSVQYFSLFADSVEAYREIGIADNSLERKDDSNYRRKMPRVKFSGGKAVQMQVTLPAAQAVAVLKVSR